MSYSSTEGEKLSGKDDRGVARRLYLTQLPLNIPLNDFHEANGAKLISFAGFNMPINYKSGIINEHINVRKNCGIFDVSHMGQILISNSDANIAYLEKYIPLILKKLQKNKSNYSFLLNNKGGVIDDLIISNIDFDDKPFLYIVYNASRKKDDEKIFLSCDSNAQILHNKNCLFAIQGPTSEQVLKSIITIPNNMNFLDIYLLHYKNNIIIVSRTGYTGEDGFEISIPIEISEIFLKELLNHNTAMLCGLGSRDSLRLEAGLSLYGHELNENITPIEAGLLWAIDKERLDDQKLNGNDVLLKQLKNKPSNIKIGLVSINRSILRKGMKLLDTNKNNIGIVTSGCFSPILNKSIAIGYINSKFNFNTDIYCEIRNKLELVQKTNIPFVKKNYLKKMR